MSVRVLNEVFEHSQARLSARLVLIVLADAAHDDGITWVPIVDRPDARRLRSIAFKSRLSEREVKDSIKELERVLLEVEVRKARRGRALVNVYRVVVGRIREVEPDYERLPFELDRPFGDVPGLGADPAPSQEPGLGADLAATECIPLQGLGAEDRSDWVQITRPYARASDPDPSVEPSEEPAAEPKEIGSPSLSTEGPDVDGVGVAAAAAPEPLREAELRAALEGLAGYDPSDRSSLPQVGLLAMQLSSERFHGVLGKVKARRRVANQVGLLVMFLRDELAQDALAEQAAMRAAQAELDTQVDGRREARVARWSLNPQAWIDEIGMWDDQQDRVERLLVAFVPDQDTRVSVMQHWHARRAELRETPDQAYARWIPEAIAAGAQHFQIEAAVDSWDIPLDAKAAYLELAERTRAAADAASAGENKEQAA